MSTKIDMTSSDFRNTGYQFIDWINNYISNLESYPVLPDIEPGDIKRSLPSLPPEQSENFDKIFSDLNNIIMPGVTHWNHPKFMAYFNSTSSSAGIFAELLSGAFNTNGMVWKSNPASTELEEVTLDWLRQMIGLPKEFWGIIYDLASSSSMHAIIAARENIEGYSIREKGFGGVKDMPRLRLYSSEQAHSSIDKGAILAGVGLEGIRKIPVDDKFRMIPSELEKAIKEDRANGWLPFCVVATVGTTSTTSIDPVNEIAEITQKENLWLHVDAAHAGIAAIVPEMQKILKGCEHADSIVVNPHKWMFMPIDISVLFTKRKEILKRAFSLVPEYLKTDEDDEVTNFMDYGIQLGRRFRALKLWFVIRYFGTGGLIEIIREHLRLAQNLKTQIDEDPHFERLAPVPLSTICFHAIHSKYNDIEGLNKFNKELMDRLNNTGEVFLSHTILNGIFTIRIVISGLRTKEKHVNEVWDLIKSEYKKTT
ncbi:Aromatic-L-amino-acid decarboxylase [hydrothermal vent metagenome]|uniref:Aromatic-L-amino-acid decarboxylase n=1 Tax=hydrothermal vent metagenome TaxID=652676 RepID=A0A3B1CJH3_9ZZZZ